MKFKYLVELSEQFFQFLNLNNEIVTSKLLFEMTPQCGEGVWGSTFVGEKLTRMDSVLPGEDSYVWRHKV